MNMFRFSSPEEIDHRLFIATDRSKVMLGSLREPDGYRGAHSKLTLDGKIPTVGEGNPTSDG